MEEEEEEGGRDEGGEADGVDGERGLETQLK